MSSAAGTSAHLAACAPTKVGPPLWCATAAVGTLWLPYGSSPVLRGGVQTSRLSYAYPLDYSTHRCRGLPRLPAGAQALSGLLDGRVRPPGAPGRRWTVQWPEADAQIGDIAPIDGNRPTHSRNGVDTPRWLRFQHHGPARARNVSVLSSGLRVPSLRITASVSYQPII